MSHIRWISKQNKVSSKPVRRSERGRVPKKYFELIDPRDHEQANLAINGVEYALSATAIDDSPEYYNEAINSEHQEQWKKAMDAEIKALEDHGTWEVVSKPQNRKIIKCRWVYQLKKNEKGEIVRYKARLTAKGFSQQYGVDYYETYSPVINTNSIRTILAVITQYNLEVEQSDIDSTFPNGILEEEIYMDQPQGYNYGNEKVLKLIKSLYGLKQAAKCWNVKFNEIMCSNGFRRCPSEQCIYLKSSGKDFNTIVGVHVDDLIIAAPCTEDIQKTKSIIKSFVNIKELGELHFLLGVKITRSRVNQSLKIDQSLYAENVVERFGMKDSSPVLTPMPLAKPTETSRPRPTDTKLYQSIVGSLMYLMLWTRPDISYSVNYLSRKLQSPTEDDMALAKRVLRYIRGTLKLGILYVKSEDLDLRGYCDASWADTEDRKSTTGYIWKFSNAPIMWRTSKQRIVALSTCETEYIAAAAAAKEGIWLGKLIKELTQREASINMLMDNQSAILIASGNTSSQRTKH
jgi:hypothetical protein